jgi:ribosomal protein L37AE/L43A
MTIAAGVIAWNSDKPHRCPVCHSATVTAERPREGVVYTCCRCGARFASDPASAVEEAGTACVEHPAGSLGQQEMK